MICDLGLSLRAKICAVQAQLARRGDPTPHPRAIPHAMRTHCAVPGYGGSVSAYFAAMAGGTKRPPR